jgi:hypothetical protein
VLFTSGGRQPDALLFPRAGAEPVALLLRGIPVRGFAVVTSIICGCLFGSQAQAADSPGAIAQNDGAHLAQTSAATIASRTTANVAGSVQPADRDVKLRNPVVIATSERAERFEREVGSDGKFTFANLKPGKWSFVVSADDMLSQTKTLTLRAGETARLNFSLEEKETAEVMELKERRNLAHPEVPSNTTFIDKNIIQNYKSGNSLRDLVSTAPGVSQDSFGNMIVRGEHNTINYVLDDVVLPEAVGQFQQGQAASPHSLKSMQVTTGGYDASAGGGPMGAIVNMQSMPIQSKPILEFTPQIGGPMQGGANYYLSTALSQDEQSRWNRVRVESSGQIFGTKLGIEPQSRHFTRNGRFDINILNKVEWNVTDRDRLQLTASINESWFHIPTPGISRAFGFKEQEHDRQNYIILSHRHTFKKWLDESNHHFLTGFYSQRLGSINAFNPAPIVNGDAAELVSASPTAKRFNFIFSAQGDVRKTVFHTHHLKAGFLSEIRPVRTSFSSFYYDANPTDATYGQLISPFTGTPVGPQLLGNVGKYRGFRFLQSAYLQDTWTPQHGLLNRLTVDGGVRFDLFHGVFGNTMGIANAIAPWMPIVGGDPTGNNSFLLKPFQTNRVTNAQVSGRVAASYKLTKSLVAKSSFAQLFTPPPVDLLPRPFDITNGTINGIFNGSLRPMQATRGYIVDTSLEQQVGGRFDVKGSLFYKHLHNVGDELPVNNTLLYQRLTLSALESYGVESRLELKPTRDGTGLFGFVSNTVMVAKLGGNHKDSGGIYDIDPTPATAKYIDHDRRETLAVGLGMRSRSGFWVLADMNYWTGFLIGLDPGLFGAHPARTKPLAIFGLNVGYDVPRKGPEAKWRPRGVAVRIQNIADNIVPINLGSPFQGTRYTIPLRVLVESKWTL